MGGLLLALFLFICVCLAISAVFWFIRLFKKKECYICGSEDIARPHYIDWVCKECCKDDE